MASLVHNNDFAAACGKLKYPRVVSMETMAKLTVDAAKKSSSKLRGFAALRIAPPTLSLGAALSWMKSRSLVDLSHYSVDMPKRHQFSPFGSVVRPTSVAGFVGVPLSGPAQSARQGDLCLFLDSYCFAFGYHCGSSGSMALDLHRPHIIVVDGNVFKREEGSLSYSWSPFASASGSAHGGAFLHSINFIVSTPQELLFLRAAVAVLNGVLYGSCLDGVFLTDVEDPENVFLNGSLPVRVTHHNHGGDGDADVSLAATADLPDLAELAGVETDSDDDGADSSPASVLSMAQALTLSASVDGDGDDDDEFVPEVQFIEEIPAPTAATAAVAPRPQHRRAKPAKRRRCCLDEDVRAQQGLDGLATAVAYAPVVVHAEEPKVLVVPPQPPQFESASAAFTGGRRKLHDGYSDEIKYALIEECGPQTDSDGVDSDDSYDASGPDDDVRDDDHMLVVKPLRRSKSGGRRRRARRAAASGSSRSRSRRS